MKLNKSHQCLNCGAEIGEANYCHNCGQLNTDKKLPVKHIVDDFIGDYFTFDSKFFKSLIPLILKPGFLTNEYLSGKRVSFIFPFRLYLFTTFLFFFIVTVNTQMDKDTSGEPTNSVIFGDSTSIGKNEISKDSLKHILNTYGNYIPESQKELILSRVDSSYEAKNDSSSKSKKFSFGVKQSDNFIVRYFEKKIEYLKSQKDAGKLLAKELINQIPKVMFILLPLFALLLKLLYFRRKFYYIEHLIFSLHFHTYIFIHLILAIFFPYWYVILFVILSIHIHLFLSLKNVYEQSKGKTFLKMAMLLTSYTFLLIPAGVLLVLLAVVSV